MVIDAFIKSHPNYSIEYAKDHIPSEYVDEKGAIVIFPPDHKIVEGFALLNNG